MLNHQMTDLCATHSHENTSQENDPVIPTEMKKKKKKKRTRRTRRCNDKTDDNDDPIPSLDIEEDDRAISSVRFTEGIEGYLENRRHKKPVTDVHLLPKDIVAETIVSSLCEMNAQAETKFDFLLYAVERITEHFDAAGNIKDMNNTYHPYDLLVTTRGGKEQ